jgi:putative nucleotidyltransferase with HDIG domain
MNRHQMKKQIDAINDLPTLPTIAMEVNHLLQDVNTPIEKLVELLERDQSMALKILRLVNSSFYGFKSRINNLRHAVTLMGYSTVQNAVVTVAVIDNLKTKLKGFDISQFWTHSISVAVMCRHLATRTKLAVPEEAFTAGLVHDIGKVVLANHFPEVFISLSDVIMADGVTFFAAEKDGDTYPHNLIGGNLSRRWMLPEPLDYAIRYHHGCNAQSLDTVLTNLVAVADTIVNVMDNQPGHRFSAETIPQAVCNPVTEVLKDSANWFPTVKQEIATACSFFKKSKNNEKKAAHPVMY